MLTQFFFTYCKVKIHIHSFAHGYSAFPAEEVPLKGVGIFIENNLTVQVRVYFGLSTLFHQSLKFICIPVPYCTSVSSLEISKCQLSKYILLFPDSLGSLVSLENAYEFWNWCFCSAKKLHGDLDRICKTLWLV